MEFNCDLETIRRRYSWLAPIYPLFELLLWLPSGIRGRAVERLKLASGERVVEIGCNDPGSGWLRGLVTEAWTKNIVSRTA
jgi:hypothetical protein